jgi:hypothetical protein
LNVTTGETAHGHIARKHGDTLISTPRLTYGGPFAPGCSDHERLGALLGELDVPSLHTLIHDHVSRVLEQICQPSAGASDSSNV